MQIKDRNQIYKIRKKFHKQSRRKYTLNRRNVFVDKNSRKKPLVFIVFSISCFMALIVVIPALVVNIGDDDNGKIPFPKTEELSRIKVKKNWQ
jgi:hypothetical protein